MFNEAGGRRWTFHEDRRSLLGHLAVSAWKAGFFLTKGLAVPYQFHYSLLMAFIDGNPPARVSRLLVHGVPSVAASIYSERLIHSF